MNKMFYAGALLASTLFAGSAWAAPQDFTLVNHTGHVVVTLNVSATSEDEWGPDILGVDVLGDDESTHITFDRDEDKCHWDIRATYDDGDTTDARNINLCDTTTVTLTEG